MAIVFFYTFESCLPLRQWSRKLIKHKTLSPFFYLKVLYFTFIGEMHIWKLISFKTFVLWHFSLGACDLIGEGGLIQLIIIDGLLIPRHTSRPKILCAILNTN